MRKYVIDRIEEGIAVCEREDGAMEKLSIAIFYPGAKEGDHFSWDGERCVYLPDETHTARERIIRLQSSLFED